MAIQCGNAEPHNNNIGGKKKLSKNTSRLVAWILFAVVIFTIVTTSTESIKNGFNKFVNSIQYIFGGQSDETNDPEQPNYDELNNKIVVLVNRVNELENKTVTLENINEINASIDTVKQNIATNTTNISTLSTKIDNLENNNTDVEQIKSDIENLQQKTETNKTEIATITGKIELLETSDTTTATTINSMQTTLSNISTNLDNMTNSLNTLKTTVETNKNDIATMQTSIQNIQTINGNIQSNLNDLTQKNADLTNSVASLNTKYDDLNGKYTTLNTNYNTLTTKYTSLNNKYSTLNSQYTTLNNQYNQLNQKYNDVMNEFNHVNENVNSYHETIMNLQSEIETLKNQLNGNNPNDKIDKSLDVIVTNSGSDPVGYRSEIAILTDFDCGNLGFDIAQMNDASFLGNNVNPILETNNLYDIYGSENKLVKLNIFDNWFESNDEITIYIIRRIINTNENTMYRIMGASCNVSPIRNRININYSTFSETTVDVQQIKIDENKSLLQIYANNTLSDMYHIIDAETGNEIQFTNSTAVIDSGKSYIFRMQNNSATNYIGRVRSASSNNAWLRSDYHDGTDLFPELEKTIDVATENPIDSQSYKCDIIPHDYQFNANNQEFIVFWIYGSGSDYGIRV